MACCADATAACLMALNGTSVALSALVMLGCLAAISATVNACKQHDTLRTRLLLMMLLLLAVLFL